MSALIHAAGTRRKILADTPWALLLCNAVIIALGLITLYSSTRGAGDNDVLQYHFDNQFLWVGIGSLLMLAAAAVHYRFMAHFVWFLYVVNLVLLVFVLFGGRAILGARRWIELGFFTLQPSEPMKLLIIFVLAKYFDREPPRDGYGFKALMIPLLLIALPFVLILKEPDLGTALLVAMVSFFILIYIGMKWRLLAIAAGAVAIAAPLAWLFLLKDYQKGRILTFIDPEHDPLGRGYQVIQAIITIGSGKMWGKGFLQGTQNQLGFIPKPHTDFIFSGFAEEWGFLGSAVLLVVYLVFLVLAMNIATKAKDRFAAILAVGIVGMYFVQVMVNMGMEIGLLPVVGIPLPFLSYGGSSMLINMVGTGLLINIAIRKNRFS